MTPVEALLASWLLSVMLVVVPPGQHQRESEDAGRERYASIAQDIAAASDGDHRMAALMLAVAYHESAFRVDVDDGRKRGDRGDSYGLWQAHVGRGRTVEGWTGRELVTDRRKGAEAARNAIRRSLSTCRHLHKNYQLAAYASGSCSRGRTESLVRIRTADRWLTKDWSHK